MWVLFFVVHESGIVSDFYKCIASLSGFSFSMENLNQQ